MPGQNALNKRKKSIEEGVYLSKETVHTLKEISKKFELSF